MYSILTPGTTQEPQSAQVSAVTEKKMESSLKLNVASAGSVRVTLHIPKNKRMSDLMDAINAYMDVHIEDMELRVDGFILPRTGGILDAGLADGDCVLVYRKIPKPNN